MGAVTALKDLARRAGQWLGRAAQPPAKATSVIQGDRFDEMTWTETLQEAPRLRTMAEGLHEKFDYSRDLMRDMFLAAYKTTPELRERDEVDVSRLVNHQVVSGMLSSPEFADLRRETAGDPYAAAMALLAQEKTVRSMLEQATTAQRAADDAAQAQQAAQDAAEQVAKAMEDAAEAADDDGGVPEDDAAAVQAAIEAAEDADSAAGQAQAAAQAATGSTAAAMRTLVRAAIEDATEQAEADAALAAAWGMEPGQLQRMRFAEREALMHRLQHNRISQFADLIGRFRRMATGERARRVEHVPGELVGITLGDDLTRLIPSEVASLGVPALRAVFAARFAEQRLMVYDAVGEVEAGQGAIIACIDCSASMAYPQLATSGTHAGERVTGEAWAKACALALLDQARTQKRDFVGILFSSASQVKVFRFPAGQPVAIGDVLDFAEHFFAGGTSFEAPLSAAVEILEDEYNADGSMRGDIVLVTDGLARVEEEWMREWNDTKHRLGFRVFGVNLQPKAVPDYFAEFAGLTDGVLDALCDNLRTLDDLTDAHAAADLFRVI